MTEAFDRTLHRVAEPRWFEDLAVGERFFIPGRTVTEAHFAAFQTVSASMRPDRAAPHRDGLANRRRRAKMGVR